MTPILLQIWVADTDVYYVFDDRLLRCSSRQLSEKAEAGGTTTCYALTEPVKITSLPKRAQLTLEQSVSYVGSKEISSDEVLDLLSELIKARIVISTNSNFEIGPAPIRHS